MNDDLFGEFIYKRTYARWLDGDQRRENWDETVLRYRSYFLDRFELSPMATTQFNKACDMIHRKEVMPSMRCLWTAGPALDRENLSGFNCFAGDTEILTFENGSVPIQDTIGNVAVLDSDGEWTESIVRSFGTQTTVEAKFGYNAYTTSYRVTLDHEWLLNDGRRVTTNELVKGDKIKFNSYARKEIYDNIDYRLGLIHGLVYADGTTQYRYKTKNINCVSQRRVKGYIIRLCGDQEDLLPIFKDYNRSYPPSANGDPIVYVMDNFAKTHSLKDLPNADYETEDYLVGFIRGWFAGDGYVSKTGQMSLASTDEGVEWVKKYAPRIGYLVQSLETFPNVTNYGVRKRTLFNINFDRKCFTADDMIISRKRDRLKPIENTFAFRGIVSDSSRDEEVFCAVVPSTHAFTLSNGMITGNCSFITINKTKSFADLLYILMCGTGAGFSVERQVITNLPNVPSEINNSAHTVSFADSRIGWARGLLEYMDRLYNGEICSYDLSLIRPKGARLKTFGGRAGGPDDLKMLLDNIKVIFQNAAGRKLNSLEVHDICCFISVAVVSAGIRRSACISLSNLSDTRMRSAKDGEFWLIHPQRSMCNNSVAFTETPDMKIFMEEWMSLMNSGSGERGIFNRTAAQKQFKELGRSIVDENGDDYIIGLNPCAEVLLRPNEVCNLTECIVRPDDTLEVLLDKVEAATVLGCFQSCLTSNHFLGPEWKKNLEEERLLGVSLTGLRDHPVLNSVTQLASIWLTTMRNHVHIIAKECASTLGINVPAASTCCKPSGSVSALLNTSSGVHTRFSPYYIRRVRVASTDTMCKFLMQVGVPNHPEVGQDNDTASTRVFEFPIKSPDGSVFDTPAQEQLEYALMLNKCWADHSTSITINVADDEWLIVGAFVYANWDDIRGMSFLPKSNAIYNLMPFETIDENEYNKRVSEMPNIDFGELAEFERDDETTGSHEFACVGGSCDVI